MYLELTAQWCSKQLNMSRVLVSLYIQGVKRVREFDVTDVQLEELSLI